VRAPSTREAGFPPGLMSAAGLVSAILVMGVPGQALGDEGQFLLGDWGGLRTSLSDQGVNFDFEYVGETAHNFSGGTAELTRYADQWTAGATLNLERLWDWQGAQFEVVLTDRSGRNLIADANIGGNQLVQEVYGGGETFRLTLAALNQTFLDGRIDWLLGRLPGGQDFANFSCVFQNLAFCGSQPGNIVGAAWINAPISVWGTRLKLSMTNDTYAQVGGYQVTPQYEDTPFARADGLTLDNPGTIGWLLPLEFGWTPQVDGRPGAYKIGAWYDTAGGADLYYDVDYDPRALTGAPALRRNGRYGGYINLEQQVTGEAGAKGVVIFLNATQADRYTSHIDRQISLGMELKQPFGRSLDFIGLGIGATDANSRQADYQRLFNAQHPTNQGLVLDGYEYDSEVFYSWSPRRSISIRPNFQYVVHPGGTTQNSNAAVVGLKVRVMF
jgi:porin